MEMKIDSVLWASGFPNAGIDPGEAYKAVEKIREKHGGKCTDADIVQAARSQRNVLHGLFTWDDSEAAEQYRRHQARTLLRSLRVVYVESEGKESNRAYEVVEKKRQTAKQPERTLYSTHEDAVKDPVARGALLADAIRQLMAWRRRFAHLNELDRILLAIDAEIEELTSVPGQG